MVICVSLQHSGQPSPRSQRHPPPPALLLPHCRGEAPGASLECQHVHLSQNMYMQGAPLPWHGADGSRAFCSFVGFTCCALARQLRPSIAAAVAVTARAQY